MGTAHQGLLGGMLAPAAGASDPRHQELNSHSTTSLPYLSATHPLSACLARQQHLWREKRYTEGFAMPYHIMPGMSQLLFSARMPSLILYICKVLYWEKVIRCRQKRRGKENEKGIWQGLFCTGGSHVASRWWSLASGTCHRLPPKSISCPTPCALTFYVETGTFHPVFYLLL